MQITSVSYSRLVSFGRYENEKVEASANVEAGETADSVLAELRAWVGARLNKTTEIDHAEGRLLEIRSEIQQIERDLHVARGKWERAAAFLEKHGIDPSTYADDIPF